MRIVSLLPAATEIVGSLGLMDSLVGVSHECDFPPEANTKSRVTQCEIHGGGLPSREIDRWVRESLATKGTLYAMDEPLLRRLQPDLILTQRLCDVCAVGYGSVRAFAATLPGPPTVLNLEPTCLEDILADVRRVADHVGVAARGSAVVASLRQRIETVRRKAEGASHRPVCVLLEWIDPPFCGGHWNPELVALAGGVDPIGRTGEDSTRITWESVVEARPEVLVLACCGFTVERTLEDMPILMGLPGWEDLPAVRQKRVHVVDGCAYFSRPGPRIVDSLEILADLLHPDIFAGMFPERETRRVIPLPA